MWDVSVKLKLYYVVVVSVPSAAPVNVTVDVISSTVSLHYTAVFSTCARKHALLTLLACGGVYITIRCPSVCLSHLWLLQQFAAVGRVGTRYRIDRLLQQATAPGRTEVSSKCEQCHVVSWRRKLKRRNWTAIQNVCIRLSESFHGFCCVSILFVYISSVFVYCDFWGYSG